MDVRGGMCGVFVADRNVVSTNVNFASAMAFEGTEWTMYGVNCILQRSCLCYGS